MPRDASGTPEFSRPVLLARIGHTPFRQEIAASEAECAALAKRFGLIALDRLSADVELCRRGDDMVLLRASFSAQFAQECVVTLEPVGGTVAVSFELLYGPPEAEETASGAVGEAVAFEPLSGDAIDIGEAVAQEFSLALPPFPRSPEADEQAEAAPAESGPFAALSRFLRGGGEAE